MIEEIRAAARRRFEELGYPSTKNEDWRFTNVAPITRTKFETAPPIIRSSVPLTTDPKLLEQHLSRYANFQDNPFTALNTANFEDCLLIQIPEGAIIEDPIRITIQPSSNGHPVVTYPRILILAGPNSQATIIEEYPSPITHHSSPCLTNPVTELVAGDNSVIDHYKLQTESGNAFHVSTTAVQLGRDTNFRSHSITLGGALVRNDVNAVLSQGAECTLNGLYLTAGQQHVDNHTSIDHAQPHAASHELYKGILDGHSSAVFNGKILVRQDAQKTDAKQTNKNLVLSEDAVINTKPELQIHADDVRCTHGATIGQLDAEALFYLQSRGISRVDARNLLILAFARDIVDRVKVPALRDQLENLLLEKLHGSRR